MKKLIITAIAGATLTLGAAVAGAQDNTPPNPGNENAPAAQQRGFGGEQFNQRPPRGGILDGEGRDLVEQYTGMDAPDVMRALRDGDTLASLIEANGEDVTAFINDAVAIGEERINDALESGRIDEARAAQMTENLREGIERRVNGEYPLLERRGERGRPGVGVLNDSEVVALVEQYTGMDAPDVVQALRDGDTLASLIEANGEDVTAFINDATTIIETRIDERAEQMKDNTRERITAFVNGEAPLRRAR